MSGGTLELLRMDDDNVPREAGRPPLTPAERAHYDELRGRLRRARSRDEAFALETYDLALALKELRERGYWMADRSHHHGDFLAWAAAEMECKDRSTAWRRLRLVSAFPRPVFEALVREQRLCLSALQLIACSHPGHRQALLEMARQPGVTMRVLESVVFKAEERLHALQSARLEDPIEGAELAAEQEMLRLLEEALADKARAKELRQAAAATRRHGPTKPTNPVNPADPAAEQRACAREDPAELAAREAELAARVTELAAREGALAALQAEVATAQARLQEEQARLHLDQGALEQLSAELQHKAQLLTGAADLGQIQRQLADAEVAQALAREGEAELQRVAAALSVLRVEEVDLAARLAALRADIEAAQGQLGELDARKGALQAQVQELEGRAGALAAREQRLTVRAEEQGALALELLRKEQKNLDVAQRLHALGQAAERHATYQIEARLEFHQWYERARAGQYRWRWDKPEDMDVVLSDLADAYERLRQLKGYAALYLKEGQLPLRTGVTHLWQLATLHQPLMTPEMATLVYDIDRAYGNADQPRYQRQLAEEKERAVKQPPTSLGGTPPGPRSMGPLPTVVHLGVPRLDPGLWGIFAVTPGHGEVVGHALGLPGLLTIVGMPNYGKSHTALVFVEMMRGSRDNVSHNPGGYPVLSIHWGQGVAAYPPDLRTARLPNDEDRSQFLLQVLKARAQGIGRVIVWVPPVSEAELARRRGDYARFGIPAEDVRVYRFTLQELGEESILSLMGAGDNDAVYVGQFLGLLRAEWRRTGGRPRFEALKEAVAAAPEIREGSKLLLAERLKLLEPYLHEGPGLSAGIEDALYIADLRSDMQHESDVALTIPLLLQLWTHGLKASEQVRGVLLDEAGKLFDKKLRIRVELERMLNEVRHRGCLTVVCAQTPLQLPPRFLNEARTLIAHRQADDDSRKALAAAKVGFEGVRREELAGLESGEALVVSEEGTDARWRQRAHKVVVRPALCKPGGTSIEKKG